MNTTPQLVELTRNFPDLTVSVKCSDLMDAFRFMVLETKLQLEQTISDEAAETYLSTDKVAEMLCVNSTTLWRWHNDKYLVPIKVGRKNRYRKSDVQAILEQRN